MFPLKMHRTRIETEILTLNEWLIKDFFFTFQRLIKIIKLLIFNLNVVFLSNPRIKATGYGFKKIAEKKPQSRQ